MLNKLLPEQISKFWPIIKYAIEQSLPPITGEHPDKMNRILSSSLCGEIDVWASYVKEGEGVKLEGIILTQIIYEHVSFTKNLLIYCVYGYAETTNDTWILGLGGLAEYAKAKGCSAVIAYSSNSHVIEIAKKLGANIDYTFISFGLNKIV